MRNLAESESELEETRPLKRVKRVNEPSKSSTSPSRLKTKVRAPKHPTSHAAPAHWRQAYDLIHGMRCARDAPVDTTGCDVAGEAESLQNKRFLILISLMLSSQTKDLVTHTAVSNLRSALRGLNASALACAPPSLVQESINKVGFWRCKAGYIQARDKYGGDVPRMLGELLELPGVGKKMGYLMLGSGWGL